MAKTNKRQELIMQIMELDKKAAIADFNGFKIPGLEAKLAKLQAKTKSVTKTAKKGTNKKAEGKETKKTEGKKTKKAEGKEKKQPVKKFESFCGQDFNPSKKSPCMNECKANMLEEFEKCKAHAETQAARKPVVRKKAERTENGRNANSQIARIEAVMKENGPLTEEEIATMAKTSVTRVRRYFRQAIYREDKSILKDSEGKAFNSKFHPKKKGTLAYVIRNPEKSAYLKKFGIEQKVA